MHTQMNDPIVQDEILTVAQLNQAVREQLESSFPLVWVKGELSNVAMPRSGHLYFTLKDESAQVRCCMFKGAQSKLQFRPQDGIEVLIRAQMGLYEPRGDYQLIVNHMEEWGLGQLQQAFEALKAKLQAEGLFDERHKKPIPLFPHHIGVVTSHTGAAIQDILSVLKRRYPLAEVTIYHTQVQGKKAAKDIVGAIETANDHAKADVLIVARGGGSLEDLWCFNEEIVARSIYGSTIPIVTGIGHEVDFTIADFVADLRAPTPSVAAERCTPNSPEVIHLFDHKLHRIQHALMRILQNRAIMVDNLEKRLVHPKQRLQNCLMTLTHRLDRLKYLMTNSLNQAKHRFSLNTSKLNAVSPLATLGRGFAIVTDEQHHVIKDCKQLQLNQLVYTQFEHGQIESRIEKISTD